MLYIDPRAQLVVAKFSSYPTPVDGGEEFFFLLSDIHLCKLVDRHNNISAYGFIHGTMVLLKIRLFSLPFSIFPVYTISYQLFTYFSFCFYTV